LPKTRAHAKFAELLPEPSFVGLSMEARLLRENLMKKSDLMVSGWHLWPGNPEMTFEYLLSVIEDIAVFAERMEIGAREFHRKLDLPKPPRKLQSATTSRVYFDRAMKRFFLQISGQPHVEIVAALEQVMFDLPNGVDESTVRKR